MKNEIKIEDGVYSETIKSPVAYCEVIFSHDTSVKIDSKDKICLLSIIITNICGSHGISIEKDFKEGSSIFNNFKDCLLIK